MAKHRKWTEKELEDIRSLISQGKTDNEIADIYDATKDHVRHLREKFGIKKATGKRRKWTPEEDRIILDNIYIIPTSEISKLIGASAYSIYKRAKRLECIQEASYLIKAPLMDRMRAQFRELPIAPKEDSFVEAYPEFPPVIDFDISYLRFGNLLNTKFTCDPLMKAAA